MSDLTRRMNILLAILAVVITQVGAQTDGPECRCGMFITLWNDAYEVHKLPPIDIDDCSAFETCKSMCAAEYRDFTNNGDLNFEVASGYSVGQEICIILSSHGFNDIDYETVYGYARQCNGPWDYDGESSINHLCCTNGHYIPCA
ncbi:uncharacterized protein [Panulirus ornatus]|uniref:uncharacterized protein n=1 Tax=Panulirus ornatus TaxID=150431 RepID=UPI003A89C2D6